MDADLRNLVWQRANGCCEYCRFHQDHDSFFRFHVEHIVAKQHGGKDEEENLVLACHHCNLHKGPNLSGIDPESGKIVPLFHLRRQRWKRHFFWDGPYCVGKTQSGRATIEVLAINHPDRIALREALIAEGVFPSSGPVF